MAPKVPAIFPRRPDESGELASAGSPAHLSAPSAGTQQGMVPRSQQGQMIVAKAEGASNQAVQVAPERLTRLEKPNRDVKLGLRFGLHPQTKQVMPRVQSP